MHPDIQQGLAAERARDMHRRAAAVRLARTARRGRTEQLGTTERLGRAARFGRMARLGRTARLGTTARLAGTERLGRFEPATVAALPRGGSLPVREVSASAAGTGRRQPRWRRVARAARQLPRRIAGIVAECNYAQ